MIPNTAVRSEPFHVRELNTLVEGMLHARRAQLGQKGIGTKHELLRTIKLDLVHILNALLEVHDGTAELVLCEFFPESPELSSFLSRTLIDNRIYHLGFECHEPLDLLLYGLEHWLKRSRELIGLEIQVTSFQRFPASVEFQRRVGAFAEILRLWIRVQQRELMLEFFDIHRPVPPRPLVVQETAEGEDLWDAMQSQAGHRIRTALQLSQDPIWHYALQISTPAQVSEIHTRLSTFVESHVGFRLAYPAVVENHSDGSVHTKIINVARKLELELVAERPGYPREIRGESDLQVFQRTLREELHRSR